jgi:TonB family protein
MTEIAAWLIPCGIVAAVLTAGAWVWESAARWRGRAARWGWLCALGGSVTLPFLLRLKPAESWREAVPAVVRLDALTVPAAEVTGARLGASDVAIAVWVALSAAVVAYMVVLLLRLAHARRVWRPSEVEGAAVLVSRDTGPAAVGIRRGVVVVPSWALELDGDLRRLMLLHEHEHVRAGDPRVLLGGLALLAVMPWQPLVWLQFLRLRNAVELDCDGRVLRRGVDPARYGSLLLEIGQRRGGGGLVLATFAEPRAFLEQRIRRIAEWPLRRRPLRASLLSVAALALFSSALLARVRVESAGSAVARESGVLEAPGVAGEPVAMRALAVDTPPPVPTTRPDPRQTPYTVAPSLQNPAAVVKLMEERYPQQLREAGTGGTASVWVLVDEHGRATRVQLAQSSGHTALDNAALAVARTMEFTPAQDEQRAVPAWIELPLGFGPLGHSVTAPGLEYRRGAQPARRQAAEIPDAPTFTPMTVRPELVNAGDVQRALIRNYPPVLRDAGIGGTAVVWFYIDEDGTVRKTQMSKSSGYPALDEAALRVAAAMQFSPARNRDRIVPVWVEIPIMFTARDQARRPREDAPAGAIAESIARAPARAPATGAGTPVAERPRMERQRLDLSSSEAPAFTPMTVRPELKNPPEVQRALIRSYPPLLRDAGIGGTPVIWFYIDEEGRVNKLQLSRSSGYPALDQAAMSVASIMQFSPAINRDKKVAVWMEIPISFTAK